MNKNDSERIHELCSQIAVEQNERKFLALVEELNRILAARDSASDQQKPAKPSG
jgi:hypothetical protein